MVHRSCHRIVLRALCALLVAGLASTARTVAAEEVTGVRWCPLSSDCLEWPPVPGVSGYYVFRGEVGTEPCLLSPLIDSCNAVIGDAPAMGPFLAEAPASRRLFWYLVTTLEPDGPGPAGSASPGPRVLDAPLFCDPQCSHVGESCDTAADCCGAECVDGSCAAACGADTLGISMVQSWFDRPIHGDIASPSHLFLDTYDLRKKKLYDLDQRLINFDGDPSTPPLGLGDPGWLYYMQGILAPGSPVDDSDPDHALEFFQAPSGAFLSFFGTEDGPDVAIADDSASSEVRDFLTAINDEVVGYTNWLGRIRSIELHEPPYLEVGGIWEPQGIVTVRVTATTSDPNAVDGVRVAEVVLDAVPFPAATGPLHSCGSVEPTGSVEMHWGTVTVVEDLEALAASADLRWDSSIPWDTPYSHVPLGVPWDPFGTYSDNLDGEDIEDPWFSLRTSGRILDAPAPPLDGGTIAQPWGFPYLFPSYDKDRDHSNLMQLHPSVTCPDAPYLFWKNLAITGGEDSHYLEWVVDDQFREGLTVKTFQDWIHGQSGFFFFDTRNGQEPELANLTPPILIHGALYTEGLVYLNALNFRAVGVSGEDMALIPPGEPFNDLFSIGSGYAGVYNAEPFDDMNSNDIWDPGEPFADTIPLAVGGTPGVYDAEPWVNLDYDTTTGGGGIHHTVRALPGTETFSLFTPRQGVVAATTTNARDRTGLPVMEEVNLFGILFTNGAFSMQGTGCFFGSVITKSGANENFFGAPSAGTPTVYFDERLARGEWPPPRLRLPRVFITGWSLE